MNSRRQFIQSTLAVAAASTMSWPLCASENTRSLSLGDTSIVLLNDGYMDIPLSFVLPDTIDEQERSAFRSANNVENQSVRQPCTLTLWKTADRTILIDAGGGTLFLPTLGQVADSLTTAGVDVSDITDVVFTHAHPDHLWGLIDDFDELTFPDASYHMSTTEWEYWRDENTMDNTPDARKSFVVGAQNRLSYLEERIQLFTSADEVLPGLEAIDTSGHTPGHTSFALHSGANSVLVLGDALTHPLLSFQHPKWPSGSDQDQQKAIETRLALLDRVVADQHAIIGFHLPRGGHGYVEKADGAFRFVSSAG